MEANYYLENKDNNLGWNNKRLTFSGNVDESTLDERYEAIAFIKALNQDNNFEEEKSDYVSITSKGSFSLTLDVPSGNYIGQVGFQMTGLNANPDDDWGYIKISGVSGTVNEVVSEPEPIGPVTFTAPFLGAIFNQENNSYLIPTAAEPFAGFANEDISIYPLTFGNGGKITFDASGDNVVIYFRFERLPYPYTDPSYDTEQINVTGSQSYTIDIPSQGTNTFSSFLLYLVTRDKPVIINNVLVYESEPASEPKAGTPIDPNDERSVKLMYGPVDPIELSPGNMPQEVIDIHQQAYRDYANKYDLWVGPLRFRYSTSENFISISGNPPIMYHYTSDTSLEFARKSALHEYTHLIQIANGAIQYINTSGGDATEQWQFMGPRWWSEGTAQWLVRAYSLNNNIEIGQGNGFQEMPNRIISYRNAVNNSIKPDGEKMTLRNVITPNTSLNPDWIYVDQFDIYNTHVYDGGLAAIDFLMDGNRSEDKIQELFDVFKDTRIKDDWLTAFLEWSGYTTFDDFHDAFDQYIENTATTDS
jgi:hypothetical protein